MIYLIGGSARCGKTTLARSVRKDFDGQVLTSDAIRVAIKGITTTESHPDIFDKIIDPLSEDDLPAKRIARLRRRDQVVWEFIKEYVSATRYSNDNVLVEGGIWPSMLHEIEQDYKAVFMVDTSLDQAERLISIRDTATYDNWMRDQKYTNDRMHKWADFNVARSKEIAKECQQLGYDLFDIANDGLDGTQNKATARLFGRV